MGIPCCVAGGETMARRRASVNAELSRFHKRMMRVGKQRSKMPRRAMRERIMKRVSFALKLAAAAGLLAER